LEISENLDSCTESGRGTGAKKKQGLPAHEMLESEGEDRWGEGIKTKKGNRALRKRVRKWKQDSTRKKERGSEIQNLSSTGGSLESFKKGSKKGSRLSYNKKKPCSD